MKFISLLILILILAFPLQAQLTRYYDVEEMFDGTDWESSITATQKYGTNGESYFVRYLQSTSNSTDTITSQTLDNRAWGGSHFISYALLTDSAGATNPDTIISYLEMGVFRGRGTVTGTAAGSVDNEGILWKPLATISAQASAEISLQDSTWWTDFASPNYWFRIRETSAQQNKYYISDFAVKDD